MIFMKYDVIRGNRKTIALQITRDGSLIVRAPQRCAQKTIEAFVASQTDWIEKTLRKVERKRENAARYVIPESEKARYVEEAKKLFSKKVAYWSEIMGLTPSYVKITSAEKRYGSCNSKKGLCFSYRLMAYPDRAIDYVVVHELAHIRYQNHSRDFYALIERYLPDYRECEKILQHEGDDS